MLIGLLALAMPWNEDVAVVIPHEVEQGGLLRIRESNGMYRMEQRDGTGWVPVMRPTPSKRKVVALASQYVG